MMKKKVLIPPFFIAAFFIVLLTLVASVWFLGSAVWNHFRATVIEEFSLLPEGVLIGSNVNPNTKKLRNIFRTIFPDIAFAEYDHQSPEGSEMMQRFGMSEASHIAFRKDVLEQQPLFKTLKDLFDLQNGVYVLKVPLVNPSGQFRIKGPPTTDGGAFFGNPEAPLSVYLYGDLLCDHCRENEQRHMEKLESLLEEGILKLIFLDLPQSPESIFHTTALACVYQLQPDLYVDFRQKLFSRSNLTKAYTTRELKQINIDLKHDCDEVEIKKLLRQRQRIADEEGITGIPAVLIGVTGEPETIRYTGTQEFSTYQTVFDQLLAQSK